MKKYLFGLGAMLVGAGLMFVLMHGEVDAKICKKLNVNRLTLVQVILHFVKLKT